MFKNNTFLKGNCDFDVTDFDKLGTKQSQDGPKSYYTELMQVRHKTQEYT